MKLLLKIALVLFVLSSLAIAQEAEESRQGECSAGSTADECVASDAEEEIVSLEDEGSMEEVAEVEAVVSEDDDDDNEDNGIESAVEETETVSSEIPVSDEEEIKEEPAIEESTKTIGTDKCPDRDHIVRCAAKYLDTNANGKLERGELKAAIAKLPWYARGVLEIIGSVNKMMKKCDVDGDGAISIDYDMQNNQKTCLASCFKRRAFKGAFFADCEE